MTQKKTVDSLKKESKTKRDDNFDPDGAKAELLSQIKNLPKGFLIFTEKLQREFRKGISKDVSVVDEFLQDRKRGKI